MEKEIMFADLPPKKQIAILLQFIDDGIITEEEAKNRAAELNLPWNDELVSTPSIKSCYQG